MSINDMPPTDGALLTDLCELTMLQRISSAA